MPREYFFGGVVKKQLPFVFQIRYSRGQFNSQMAVVMLQVIHSFYKNYSKNSLFSAKTSEKFIVSKDYCIAYHDDKLCIPIVDITI